MMLGRFLLISALLVCCFGCGSKVESTNEKRNEFLEIRITRWTALEGGEIFVLQKVNTNWSAMLLGDGVRFSCQYQKSVQPKSGWENVWDSLQNAGLLEIPEGDYEAKGWTDGDGFNAEIFYQDRLKRFRFYIPKAIDSKEAKQILQIGNIISNEFDTPMFKADYSRSEVGDYLIENCKDSRESTKK
jgi:hypothetical protein